MDRHLQRKALAQRFHIPAQGVEGISVITLFLNPLGLGLRNPNPFGHLLLGQPGSLARLG